ncbi:hypothetical protein [Alienimonas chondri]|uniref:Uncharacterized protein n=1 Tax=Alienimonas chondri TaxID=2681879 RepID=A0ABX1VH58_9PLAN|nr:hypothetical protein [Alienimonas chondri]NNJ27489.1 hypothetical protein [Alienimonas chondri]
MPHPPHSIRLRGPWEWAAAGVKPVRATLPHTSKLPGTLSRRFNAPTGLEDGTRAVLRIADVPLGTCFMLNGSMLPPAGPDEFSADITALLTGPCRLEIAMPADGTISGVTLDLHLPEPPEQKSV